LATGIEAFASVTASDVMWVPGKHDVIIACIKCYSRLEVCELTAPALF